MKKREDIEIGIVCEKGRGHIDFHDDPANGGCGSHAIAKVVVQFSEEEYDDIDVDELVAHALTELRLEFIRQGMARLESDSYPFDNAKPMAYLRELEALELAKYSQ